MKGLTYALAVVVGLALVGALPGLAMRAGFEVANRQVELVMDLDQLELMAESQGYRTDEVVAELAWAGLTAVTWNETNLDKLSRSGDLEVFEGREIADRIAAGPPPSTEVAGLAREGFFRPGYTYAVARDQEAGRWLEDAAATHLPAGRWNVVRRGAQTILEITLLKERALLLPLGFYEPEIERSGAARLGLRVVPRPANVAGGQAAVEREAAFLLETGRRLGLDYSAVIFHGGEVLGYPGRLDATADLLRSLAVPPGLIETKEQLGNIGQLGLRDLVQRLGYQAVRVYSVPDVRVFAPADLADKTARSVKERGLRVAYLQPYLVPPEHLLGVATGAAGGGAPYERPAERAAGPDYTPMLALNVDYVRQLAELLRREGMDPGRPLPLRGPGPLSPGLVAFLALGPAAGLGLAWLALRPRSRGWCWLGAAGALLVAASEAVLALAGRAVLAAQVAALLAALVFPSLGLAWLAATWVRAAEGGVRSGGTALLLGLRDLAVASAISLVGGLFVGGILADLRFVLELELFRGVKLTYLAPPVAALIYWLRYRYPEETRPSGWPRLVAGVARRTIKVWHAAVAAILGAGLVFYVGRSGQTSGLPVGSLELRFNHWLERALYARPRLKEILLGHPALVAGGWLARTGRQAYLGWFILAASAGQVSLVNSFEHVRSPFLLSLARGANGLWLGALAGLAVVAVLSGALRHAGRLDTWLRRAAEEAGAAGKDDSRS